MKQILLGCVLLFCMGCSQVNTVNFTDVTGDPCQSTHVKTTWYTAETLTTCNVNGKAVAEVTNHTDISIVSAIAAALATLIPVSLL